MSPAALVFGLARLAAGGAAAAAEELRTIPSRPGVTQSFLLVRPVERALAAVVLFAGGNGRLDLRSGRLGLAFNFLVRNRARFAQHGLLVAVVDAPSDHVAGLDGFRTSAAHADDVRAVIAALRDEDAGPCGWSAPAWGRCRPPTRRPGSPPGGPTGSC